MDIKINKDICIGCGVCAAMVEDIFAINENSGLAEVLSQNSNNKEIIEEVIETCPVNAISLLS